MLRPATTNEEQALLPSFLPGPMHALVASFLPAAVCQFSRGRVTFQLAFSLVKPSNRAREKRGSNESGRTDGPCARNSSDFLHRCIPPPLLLPASDRPRPPIAIVSVRPKQSLQSIREGQKELKAVLPPQCANNYLIVRVFSSPMKTYKIDTDC